MERLSAFDITITTCAILLIVAWLAGIAFYLKKLLYDFTFKDWGSKENPYKDETLGLPRGTLRGVLTLTLLIVVVVLVCTSMVVKPLRGGFDSLVDAFEIMLAFYFGSKIMHHVTDSDKKKTISKNESDTAKAKYEVIGNTNPGELDEFCSENSVG
jgi:uncharacterized membrane protein